MATVTGSRGGFSLRRGNERFERERDRFRQATKDNLELALDVNGLTLLHSLPIDEGTELLEKFGFEPKDAVEYYNRGVVAAQKDNLPKAIEWFRKAAATESTLLDAIYNLAACYERSKQTPQALSTWQTYLDSIKDKGDEELIKTIKERIAGLKAKQK